MTPDVNGELAWTMSGSIASARRRAAEGTGSRDPVAGRRAGRMCGREPRHLGLGATRPRRPRLLASGGARHDEQHLVPAGGKPPGERLGRDGHPRSVRKVRLAEDRDPQWLPARHVPIVAGRVVDVEIRGSLRTDGDLVHSLPRGGTLHGHRRHRTARPTPERRPAPGAAHPVQGCRQHRVEAHRAGLRPAVCPEHAWPGPVEHAHPPGLLLRHPGADPERCGHRAPGPTHPGQGRGLGRQAPAGGPRNPPRGVAPVTGHGRRSGRHARRLRLFRDTEGPPDAGHDPRGAPRSVRPSASSSTRSRRRSSTRTPPNRWTSTR